MKKILILLLSFTLIISLLSACREINEEPETVKFTVETAFEYSYEKDGHFRYVIMPKVADHVPEGNIINEQLLEYNTLEELQESETWTDWAPEQSFRQYYDVSNIDGICSLNIIYENLVENGDPSKPDNYYPVSVQLYYYNENINKVLTQSEYLSALGTSEEKIIQQFNREYGDQYTNRTYDLRHIMFWYDGNNDLQFSAYYIDQMDSNTADFHLIINGQSYKTGERSPDKSPFGDTVNREEKYADEVWAGSWWIEEYYDGAFILYLWNKDLELKTPYRVEISKKSNDVGFTAETYRGAAVSDSRSRILELYPEIDPDEQYLLTGTKNLYRLIGNGYLYLEFHFEKDIVTKIIAGTMID